MALLSPRHHHHGGNSSHPTPCDKYGQSLAYLLKNYLTKSLASFAVCTRERGAHVDKKKEIAYSQNQSDGTSGNAEKNTRVPPFPASTLPGPSK